MQSVEAVDFEGEEEKSSKETIKETPKQKQEVPKEQKNV